MTRKSFDSITHFIAWCEGSPLFLEYIDNVRSADLDNPEELEEYSNRRACGCCGSYDDLVYLNGKLSLVGCNYGH